MSKKHKKAVDIGTQQTNPHSNGHKQGIASGPSFYKEQRQYHRYGEAGKDIFDISHFPTSRRVNGSNATMDSVSVMSTAK